MWPSPAVYTCNLTCSSTSMKHLCDKTKVADQDFPLTRTYVDNIVDTFSVITVVLIIHLTHASDVTSRNTKLWEQKCRRIW